MTATAMGFIGVDTAHSSIMRVFPLWADELGLPSRTLRGHDVPLGAPDHAYRDLVTRIRDDPTHLGALVTTHKIRVYDACGDLFDDLDESSQEFGEISSISKRDGRLRGAAKDPVTAGLALHEFLGDDWFARTGGETVCLGAGGAGTAISVHLARRADRCPRVTVTDVDPDRLAHLRTVHERAGLAADRFRYVHTETPAQAAALVVDAVPGSLVVNATGLGKDRPGSPVPPGTVFPRSAAVWEINYRGELGFLRDAERQRDDRGLTVADGWRYFIHGWSQVIADVFALAMPPATVERLAALAEAVR
jgi:shikimate 5-dehydrogenase